MKKDFNMTYLPQELVQNLNIGIPGTFGISCLPNEHIPIIFTQKRTLILTSLRVNVVSSSGKSFSATEEDLDPGVRIALRAGRAGKGAELAVFRPDFEKEDLEVLLSTGTEEVTGHLFAFSRQKFGYDDIRTYSLSVALYNEESSAVFGFSPEVTSYTRIVSQLLGSGHD